MNTIWMNRLKKVLKFGVTLAACWFIYSRIQQSSFSYQDIVSKIAFSTLFLVGLLSALNWTFEILKWKTVIQHIEKIGFKRAAFESFVGYTYGLITPFNSGNYARKAFFYKKTRRLEIVGLNFIKGIYQLSPTALMGILALLSLPFFKSYLPSKIWLIIGFVVLLIPSIVLLKKKLPNSWKKLSTTTHIKLILYSFIRFVCFSSGLFILLTQHSTPECGMEIYLSICSVYLLGSILPILNLLDFAIKSSLAIWILEPLGFSPSYVLICYFVMWLFNNACPATLGAVWQFKHKQL